jgi:serine phosphatase RsbU (regulator of sigma subunit)
VKSVTRVVQGQLPRLPDTDKSDFWWEFVDSKQPELGAMAQTISSLAPAAHNVRDISILSRFPQDGSWHRLYLDGEDTLKSEPFDHPRLKELEADAGNHFVDSDPGLYVNRGKMSVLVNITSPLDEGQYFFRIVIARGGAVSMLGGRALHFIGVSLVALIIFRMLGYLFARRLAEPIKILSDAAAKVAAGDLSPQVPPLGKNEIGTLGSNFNQMILGLREWQRIKRMEVELEKGREIQQEFLPREIPNIPNWDIATSFYPAREVSGDFYDVFDLPDGLLGLVIADVCDKGVGSALYMALIRSLIRVFAEQSLSGQTHAAISNAVDAEDKFSSIASRGLEVVRLTNSYLARHHGHEGMFATLFFGVLDSASGQLIYINGGHEPLYVVGKNGIKAELPPTGPAVGLMEDIHFDVLRLQLGPGDLLLGLTDGVTEALNPENEFFTRQRVKKLLARPVSSSKELLERIRKQVFDFMGTASRSDDVTMLAVQWVV